MKTATTISELYKQLNARFVPFSIAFFAAVFVTYLLLYILDIYPEPVTPEPPADEQSVATVTVKDDQIVADEPAPTEVAVPVAVSPYPLEISFDALNRTVPVLNPESAEYNVLDMALMQGVVRHPQSADFVNTGNIVVLGHSSYLPNVLNKNFQAFNGIEHLEWGDTVRLKSDDTEYVYRVDRVYFAPASDVFIPVGDDPTPKLTLVTCKVLGAKEDRYILEARLIEKVALAR